MKKFGYLAAGDTNSEALHTEESITEAVRQMQQFGGLQPSGVLDEATLKLLSSPRCGNKDTKPDRPNAHSRHKRFIIGAKGWKKRTLTWKWVPYELQHKSPSLFQSRELDSQAWKQGVCRERVRESLFLLGSLRKVKLC